MNEVKTRVMSNVDQDEKGIIITFHVMADAEVSEDIMKALKIKAEESEPLLHPFQEIVSEILERNKDNDK
ncbi:MAG: hypothetical protein C4617_04830 [Candidatus Liberibacter europaeus]|uniref:Uncharacterized protein n=1 Tax=Candidatus Liberibacter europaeus TaxID=744859 RepID=A0A2T4VWP9_9HYPH|nr:hypothetical protein [Candidatus Liberibacter europaeus]PTL86196.1 MAG: hypothetical protein C4617_04830 [Candidatus Liberibacter europaeus]